MKVRSVVQFFGMINTPCCCIFIIVVQGDLEMRTLHMSIESFRQLMERYLGGYDNDRLDGLMCQRKK